ncbi:TATA element modulatory factor 1 TATA binding-domain-containing protein [Staphylotrichum tortipilum]|uniref:TATA element modulatory factor 1 TATA binding-domain-containing protein n=1 Tax=Staphylotrichum tortipilum TaxID=2831512 RepID=A0AAN6MKR3_9PEZI|nr:TATA element modulatory factor 1 TATA binding-domain-containing protein [Staphylotrichum longicolle]
MAAPSRWGSFLSQAVAGVEARLDNILAEEEGAAQQRETKPVTPGSPAKQSPSISASTARPNDRLQERLARALAAKSASRNSMSTQGSPRQSLDAPTRTSTDSADHPSPTAKEFVKDTPSPRASQDMTRTSLDSAAIKAPEMEQDSSDAAEQAQEPVDEVIGTRTSAEISPAPTPLPSNHLPTTPAPLADTTAVPDDANKVEPAKHADKALEDAQLQYQEEIHGYVERIDALEAKLQFLAREATDSARKAALAAPAGGVEKKLAEKDQQIAQLMEEGKNLASTDHKHRALVKKLRTTLGESEKELVTLRATKEKSDREIDNLRSRARRADELEKAHDDVQKRLSQTQKELAALRPEARSKDSTIAELRAQLQAATDQADAMTTKVNTQAREQDKRQIADLEEEVAALKIEKNLAADRTKTQTTELREKAERANERARALEIELKAEMQVVEGKLEAMRMRAEEASSGAAGDSQAKLLRQVETLQTQYSIASENWQGIETTLLARITGLERERDEALQRESDMRRKAREAAVRAKLQEEELEVAKTTIPTIQEDVKTYQAQLDALKKRAEEAESALTKANADFEKQKQTWEAEKEERQLREPLERPRSWLEGLPGGSFLKPESRPASPQLTNPQRTFSTDYLGITTLTGKARKVSAPSASTSDAGASALDSRLTFSRRPSAQPPSRPTLNSQPGSSGGGGIFSPLSVFSPTSETSPHHHHHNGRGLGLGGSTPNPLDREVHSGEDAFGDGAPPPAPPPLLLEQMASPQQLAQQPPADLVSVSTVAAGPSVQLVERMSAAIRRLESEKVAAREELARMARQRDEGRAEMVALMREAEGGRAAAKRAEGLEREVAEVKERYETTLELLGEKSELVDELRADVEDVKAMYRDLVERTVK